MSETSGLVLCGRGEDSQRESLQSQLTATTNYSRHSTLTYSSSVSSCASKTSTESRDTITKPQPEKPTRSSAHAQLSLNTKCGNTEDAALKTAIDGEKDTDANASGKMDPDKQGDEPASPSKFSPASNSQQPKSIIERRLARKAKVHEYKMRDLDASRIDSVDSPVLGYFASNLPGRPSSPVEASSVPANSARRPSTLSMSMTTDEVSNGNDAEEISDLPHDVSLDEERSRPESDPKSASTPGLDLKISAVVSTGIEPVYVTPDWHNSGIAMSPIMVVADVESLPGSSILPSWSSRPRQDSISPRPVSILKPLKISTHSRQTSRSVTISRNPATGVIERSASGTVDPKFKRRSLMTIPTPPLSPEVTPLPRKRLSLPPVQLQIPVIPQDRSPLSQTQDFDSSSDEEVGSESRFRSTASLKERIMREKMQKEKEITDIVARTVGPPQKPTIYETEQDPVPLDQGNGESLEKRLRRLERTNDAWLCAMKPLLETMARTLDDMRVEDRCRSLRMSDFVLDKDTEAAHSIASRPGSVVKTTLKRPGTASSTEKKARNAAGASSAMPLSPIIQELEDDSPVLEKRESPTGSKRSSGPSQGQLTQGPGSFCSTQVGTGPAGQGGGEPNDWSDLGSRIRDMGVLPRNSQEELEVRARKGTHGSGNTLHPVMRDLMSASHLYADKVGGAP
ncbi:hypothetical protein F4808DRAFT_426093 [Astrocystis sublimbata]|nr:hypothetical protein F4808DRAFT_426093 [Astrocystis sublimbata]